MELLAYAALGLALWPVPLLGLVHVEASAVVAFAAFFVAGLAALRSFSEGASPPRSFRRVLARQEALLAVPLLLLTVTLLWRPNCDYLRGLLFYLLFPPVTVVFAVALAYALAGLRLRFRKTVLVVLGLGVSLLGPLYDLGLHPQFYTYNHVFGGVLGPLYDEALALRPGLFAFRALTLLWALLFWLIGRGARGEGRGARGEERDEDQRKSTIHHPPFTAYRSLPVFAVAALIGVAYLNAGRLGFNTSAERLQEALGGHVQTEHFDIYFDPDTLSGKRLAYLAEDHEWRYRWLKKRLGTAPPQSRRIASYLYPDVETKARLTGARRTSVAPVWLARPQTHVLLSAYERSFGHELVHAFSRGFGLPLIKASRSVGLVEGLAVAFEPPSGRPSPSDQVSAAALLDVGDRREQRSLAEDVAARLSPLGFWTGRGAVGYTTMGAFVRFLRERYGAARLRRVYAWGDFEAVYGKPLRALAEEWEKALFAQPVVARSAGVLAERRFTRPSIFEKRCPHYVPPSRRAYRAGRDALAEGDTAAAVDAFARAVQRRPAYERARVAEAQLLLSEDASSEDASSEALRLFQTAPDSSHGALFQRTLGDAQVLLGRPRAARRSYTRALTRLPLYRHGARALVLLRRQLSARPAALRILVGSGPAPQRAQQLAKGDFGTPAAAMLRVLLLAEGERYDAAARLLEQTRPVGERGSAARKALRRQRLVWLARLWHRAGVPTRAKEYAGQAARAFHTLGDYDTAARLEELSRKMAWVQRRGDS